MQAALCDERVMADGKFVIGLNETQVRGLTLLFSICLRSLFDLDLSMMMYCLDTVVNS